jgi:hemin uptake protein HemP
MTKMDGNVWSLGGSPMSPPGREAEAPLARSAGEESLPRHDVRTLMAGGNRAMMVLDGKAYTLRITRAGKLILTK